MAIYVKQEHINKGSPDMCRFCPVALAIRDVVKNCDIKVLSDRVNLYQMNNYWTSDLPQAVIDFIYLFDHNGVIKPFDFELEIPAEWLNA